MKETEKTLRAARATLITEWCSEECATREGGCGCGVVDVMTDDVIDAARDHERAEFQADMADQLAQPLQVLLSASETICIRLRQLGVQDADIDESARLIERAVERADAIARGKTK